MNIRIGKELSDEYISQRKNMNYALSFLLDSVDREATRKALKYMSISSFSQYSEVDIDDSIIEKIKKRIAIDADDSVIEKLLLIALLFPEV